MELIYVKLFLPTAIFGGNLGVFCYDMSFKLFFLLLVVRVLNYH